MAKMTDKQDLQKTFNKVYRHLLTQKKKAYSKAQGICLYRTPKSGLKCAVGCLIPNRLYQPDMEGSSVRNLAIFYQKLAPIVGETGSKKARLVTDLQYVHDTFGPSKWAEQLAKLAEAFDLKIPKIAK